MSSYEDVLKKLGAPAPLPESSEGIDLESAPQVSGIADKLMSRDNQFDYSGVPSFGFRAEFSQMDTDQERQSYLTKKLGQGGWTQDRFGRWAVTPQGMEALNLEHQGKPVTIDEPSLSRYDIADLRGDAPAIAGAMAGGALTGGMGLLPAAGLVGLGAAGGKGYQEASEALKGQNIESPGEIAKSLATEGGMAAAGEGIFRGVLRPLGRKILRPQAHRVTAEAKKLMQESLELGAKPSVTQVTHAPIMGRAQSMFNRIFGDPAAAQNARALRKEMVRLRHATGPKVSKMDVGQRIANDITRSRKALSKWSNKVYSNLDEMTGNEPIIPTQRVKQVASDILESLPKTKEGVPAFASPEMSRTLSQIGQIDDLVTTNQMQAIRQQLYNAIQDNTIVPGVSSHHARLLYKAAGSSFDDAVSTGKAAPEVIETLKRINSRYAKEISKFDDAFINRIVKNPKYASSIPPEKLVSTIFRKGQQTNINKIMKIIPESSRKSVRRAAMDDILQSATSRTDDPLVAVFEGKNFLNTLDSYGKDTLISMFGKQRTTELYKFGRVTQNVTQKMAMSGGLVAAHVALHPWQNLGRLIKYNLMSRFMNTDKGLKWLTTGLDVPKTRLAGEHLTRFMTQLTVLSKDETGDFVQTPDFGEINEP